MSRSRYVPPSAEGRRLYGKLRDRIRAKSLPEVAAMLTAALSPTELRDLFRMAVPPWITCEEVGHIFRSVDPVSEHHVMGVSRSRWVVRLPEKCERCGIVYTPITPGRSL